MRLPFPRITAFVALCAALSTVVVLSTPRNGSGGRDRDRVVRMTRGGLQRFDAGEALSHDYESPEPTAAVAADASADQLSVHAPPGGAAMLTAGPAVGPPGAPALLSHQSLPAHIVARPALSHLGRAPPPTV